MGFYRPCDQLIDEPDHRCFARQILEAFGILFGRFGVGQHLVEQRRAVARLLGSGIKPAEGGFQLGNGDHHGMAECRRHRITGKDIKRVGHGKGRTTVGSRNRQRAHLAQELDLQPVEKQRCVRVVAGFHQRRPDQLRQRFG